MKRPFVLALVIVSCGGEEERPDPYVPPGTDNLTSCGDLQQASPSGSEIWFDGRLAGCAVDGLQCPLPDAFLGHCDAGQPYAQCLAHAWFIRCITDGGTQLEDAAP